MSTALILFALFTSAHMYGQKVFRRVAKEKINMLERRLGMPVDVGEMQLLGLNAYLEDITIGDDARVVASQVKASLVLNPFSSRFLDLDTVSVNNLRVKAPAYPSGRFLQDKASGLTANAKDARSLSEVLQGFFANLPSNKLWLKSGHVILLDEAGESLLQVRGLRMLLSKEENKLLFRADHVKSLKNTVEKGLQGRLVVDHDNGDLRWYMRKKRPGKSAANDWTLSGRLNKNLTEFDATIDARNLPGPIFNMVQKWLANNPIVGVKAGIKAQRDSDGVWRFKATAESRKAKLHLPLASSTAFGPINVDAAMSGYFLQKDRIFAIEEASINVPTRKGRPSGIQSSLRLNFSGAGRVNDNFKVSPMPGGEFPLAGLSFQGQLRMPSTPCQTIIDASPPGFTPTLDEFVLRGDSGLGINLSFDGDKPDSLAIQLSDAFWNCQVESTPFAYDASYLNGPFVLHRSGGQNLAGEDLPPVEVSVSPERPGFAPIKNLNRAIPAAFIAAEDAAFYSHKGIDTFALENAARRNFAEKRIAMGGSTITMQTVKNLYLSHERTLARKLQEFFLAWHLENILSKERILEIYVNIVEFGPGLYGLGQASAHFFAKAPEQLNLMEAAYLASLLPSPKVRYRNTFCAGHVTNGIRDIMQGLLRRMVGLGRLSQERYAASMMQSVRFNEMERRNASYCASAQGEHSDGT